MSAHKRSWAFAIGALLALLLVGSGPGVPQAQADDAVKRVHCERGQSLARALEHARPGDTFLLSGTCQERVTIAIDWITLDGEGSAVIDGGGGPAEFSAVVTIRSASGVTIKGLTVRNGPGEGIRTQGGASFTLQAAEVDHNGFTGVLVDANSTAEVIDTNIHHNGSQGVSVRDNSTAKVIDTHIHDNRFAGVLVADNSRAEVIDTNIHHNSVGVDVFNISSVVVRGAITIADNSGNGVAINGESVFEIRGARVNASHNGEVGMAVTAGQLAIYALAASEGSTLDANDNGLAGIFVGTSRMTVFSAAKVTASRNGGFGLFLLGNGFLFTAPGGGATFLIEDNDVGIRAEQGAGFIFQGGQLTVTNNGVGLAGDGAGTLTILSMPATPSSISGNGLDVSLAFGTRATFQGVAIGSITCDATVLSRGTTVCP